ncbi:MAG: zinc-ribbon domain-containing protein [bacterium]|nr:zinc-ribbon domain-containing protein [bacterium]
MITTCTDCHARYRLEADRVPHRKIRVRCPSCRGVFQLDGTVRAVRKRRPRRRHSRRRRPMRPRSTSNPASPCARHPSRTAPRRRRRARSRSPRPARRPPRSSAGPRRRAPRSWTSPPPRVAAGARKRCWRARWFPTLRSTTARSTSGPWPRGTCWTPSGPRSRSRGSSTRRRSRPRWPARRTTSAMR